jgi:hypothetical protein
MEDYACLCINAGGGDALISADSGVGRAPGYALGGDSSTGPARQSVATLVPTLECVQSLNGASSVIGVTSPGARDLQSNRSLAQPSELHGGRVVAVSRLAEWTIAGAAYPPGRRYPVPCALRMASTPSSTLSSGVVLNAFAAPAAAMAIANAAGIGVLRHLDNADDVVLAEGQPRMFELPAQLLDNRTDCLEPVLRLLDHGSPRIRRVCRLNEIAGHAELPSAGLDRPGRRSSCYADEDLTSPLHRYPEPRTAGPAAQVARWLAVAIGRAGAVAAQARAPSGHPARIGSKGRAEPHPATLLQRMDKEYDPAIWAKSEWSWQFFSGGGNGAAGQPGIAP